MTLKLSRKTRILSKKPLDQIEKIYFRRDSPCLQRPRPPKTPKKAHFWHDPFFSQYSISISPESDPDISRGQKHPKRALFRYPKYGPKRGHRPPLNGDYFITSKSGSTQIGSKNLKIRLLQRPDVFSAATRRKSTFKRDPSGPPVQKVTYLTPKNGAWNPWPPGRIPLTNGQ